MDELAEAEGLVGPGLTTGFETLEFYWFNCRVADILGPGLLTL
jgi:hypothetical protein